MLDVLPNALLCFQTSFIPSRVFWHLIARIKNSNILQCAFDGPSVIICTHVVHQHHHPPLPHKLFTNIPWCSSLTLVSSPITPKQKFFPHQHTCHLHCHCPTIPCCHPITILVSHQHSPSSLTLFLCERLLGVLRYGTSILSKFSSFFLSWKF